MGKKKEELVLESGSRIEMVDVDQVCSSSPNSATTSIEDQVASILYHLGKDEEMMSHESYSENSAINLSTTQTSRGSSSAANGTGDSEDSQSSNKTVGKGCDGVTDSTPLNSAAQLLMVPHQSSMQKFLSPTQIQQFLQHQALYYQRQQHQQQQLKQLESFIPHLQEQLQINMLQQNQVLQQLTSLPMEMNSEKGSRHQLQAQLQQLSAQQHQLIQQLQQSHRQYFMASTPYNSNAAHDEKPDSNATSWKNNEEPNITNGNHHGPTPQLQNGQQNVISPSITPPSSRRTATPKEDPQNHLLFGHGVCKWPGCETFCDDYQDFLKHLNHEHQLDDRSTAQARVQMQVVSQLEMQLDKEKNRLQAMMEHLHMKTTSSGNLDMGNLNNKNSGNLKFPTSKAVHPPHPLNLLPSCNQVPLSMSSSLLNIPSRLLPSLNQPLLPPPPSGPMRRRLSDKGYHHSIPESHGFPEIPVRRRAAERVNLDITEEITRNREFYKNADVRPPFTYASLIRQAIIESPERQLTLNEIYNWFQNTFCYFRRNAATWKNAVRHNLSLHKCFMRVENIKGAVWTVDEIEFYKRRPQRLQERIGTLSLGLQDGHSPTNNKVYPDPLNTSQTNSDKMPNYSSITSMNNNVIPPSCRGIPTTGNITSCAISDAESFVSNLVCHGVDITNSEQRKIHVKQEPPQEDMNDGGDRYLVEEPAEGSGSDEAEDLSTPQNSGCINSQSSSSRLSLIRPNSK
ncbi:forkhead box protein P1 isoform X3 [Parasteatoda tepidariorum]|uniref:forkhead box protein P1 isoform X3 n=1 Tax=Parasteatoda tepidariorum TaxID=114398 RepID=UPI00077FD4B8|nr:forkhead box protein P1 isoform X1 [Parasteatoda tepidariorum]